MKLSSATLPPVREGAEWAVFADFDGTLADHDTIDLLVETFLGREYARTLLRRLAAGEMTVRAVIDEEFTRLHLSPAAIAEFLTARVRLDPRLPDLLALARERGVPFAILSSGVDALILPLLRAGGCPDVELICNALEARETDGRWNLRVLWRDDSDNGHDKAAALRRAQAAGRRVIYLGDGITDLDCAHVADVVFAKRHLARYCRERGLAHHALPDCGAVVQFLRRATAAAPAAVATP